MRCEASAVMTADGLQGLWRGVLPSLYRTVPGVGLYFSSMHWMRHSVFNGKPNAGQSLLIGAALLVQDRTWGRPLLLLNALDAPLRLQRKTERWPIPAHRSCRQDFCWICHDPLHRGQDQDGVWCLPIPISLHSTELNPLCRGPSRTHQRSWSYPGKGCSLLQPLPGLLRPAEEGGDQQHPDCLHLSRGSSHGHRTWRWTSCQPCHSA